MEKALLISIIGLALLILGIAFPYVVPADESYRYEVNTIQNTSVSSDSQPETVAYSRLSSEEKQIFDTSLTEDRPIIREEPVNGTTYITSYDQVGLGVNMVAVSYQNSIYIVEGYVIRSNVGLRFWGGPVFILIGALLGTIGLIASKTDLIN